MSKMKSKSKVKAPAKKNIKDADLIVIDESKGLIFENEESLFAYFEPAIAKVEKEYESNFQLVDFSEEEQKSLETNLDDVLDQPDQIWKDESLKFEFPIYYFIKKISGSEMDYDYIAVCYMDQDEHVPTFVLSHFPTRDPELTKFYKKTELIYDIQLEGVRDSSVDGDALGDGDELALGLFQSMLVLRGEKDIPQNHFMNYASLREECIEHPDEIWKKIDSEGRGLVTFIKEFSEHETKNLYYVSVTLEDAQTQVHTLLFSFPTIDETLVDRYRQGENLQAEEVVQESSH